MRSLQSIADILRHIDGRGYKAYRELGGGYGSNDLELYVDHVQGDHAQFRRFELAAALNRLRSLAVR